MTNTVDYQYIDLCKKILDNGVWVENERTGKRCLTIINHDLEYNVAGGVCPLDTTRESNWEGAVAELLGYIRGYNHADDFKELGTGTWAKNANAEIWQNSPFCKGAGDMGRAYGVQGNNWKTYAEIPMHKLTPEAITKLHELGYEVLVDQPLLGVQVWKKTTNQLKKIFDNLKRGVDDRGEILMFHNPGEVDQACLRSCMYSHHFSLLDGTLYLNSTQRSVDVPLGLNYNMVQVYVFLLIMARATGHRPGVAYHKLINTHFYEDQLDTITEQMEREPFPCPTLELRDGVKLDSYEDLLKLEVNDFVLSDYQSHGKIRHKFTE
ncbi:thymidylate synthase [Vibrio phage vB_VcorM_GR11A]|nr:thymidylate synthase [Vibrio phage vB_VcorM_GR11A]